MIEMARKPILEWQTDILKMQGIHRFVIAIGYFGHVIKDYFGDGLKFGVEISYIEEEKPFGTAGALGRLRGTSQEDFLLVNRDIVFDVDVERFRRYYVKKQALVIILAHLNDHLQDSGLIEAERSLGPAGGTYLRPTRLWRYAIRMWEAADCRE